MFEKLFAEYLGKAAAREDLPKMLQKAIPAIKKLPIKLTDPAKQVKDVMRTLKQ